MNITGDAKICAQKMEPFQDDMLVTVSVRKITLPIKSSQPKSTKFDRKNGNGSVFHSFGA